MKKGVKKLALNRETLRRLDQGDLRRAGGESGESQCVSHCVSDTFPGNCPKSWNCGDPPATFTCPPGCELETL